MAFLKYMKEIDMVVFTNAQTKKKFFGENCFPRDPNKIKRLLQIIQDNEDDILKATMKYYIYKFEYAIQQFCYMCDPAK